jgi:N-glycosylase/DNA lyase
MRIELRGAGGEPVSFWHTVASHGLAFLPPFEIDADQRTLRAALRVAEHPREVIFREVRGALDVEVIGSRPVAPADVRRVAARVFRLDEDLSPFYSIAVDDQALSWATVGAGRLLKGASLFEDVVKTICTTNCTWSATVRMVTRLVEGLGETVRESPGVSTVQAFPTPASMALAPETFYSEEMRCGYRGRFLRSIAEGVASEAVDLEGLCSAAAHDVTDAEVESQLLELPGVGPYAAAHIMLLMGRYSRFVLDSWTRPKYAQLVGKAARDVQIRRRFRSYGPFAGLAFWLFVTQDWVGESTAIR